jgi:putative methionine-R-sulfoxide reductase with GAF domain
MNTPRKKIFITENYLKAAAHSPDGGLLQMRNALVEGILRVILFVAPVVIVVAIFDAIELGTYWSIPFYVFSYLLVVLFNLRKNIPFVFKAWTIIGLIYMRGFTDFIQDGYQSSARVFMVTVTFMAAVLFGRRAGMLSLIAAFLTFLGFGVLFETGVLSISQNPEISGFSSWLMGSLTMALMGSLIVISIDYVIRRMTELLGELEVERSNLEERVAERTQALETSAEVSRRLSTILDQQELVTAVVEEVQRSFNYYHVHIYLFDEHEENLVMVGGTGEAGQLLLSRGHKIPRSRGLVGRAAEQNRTVLVPDTLADPGWLSNPLLPETRAEIAVPMIVGEHVLGVLDVQHNIVNGLDEEDAALLGSIANQVAVAVQNARMFSASQRQMERETQLNIIGQRIRAAGTIEDVLEIAARELSRTLRAERASIQVGGISLED